MLGTGKDESVDEVQSDRRLEDFCATRMQLRSAMICTLERWYSRYALGEAKWFAAKERWGTMASASWSKVKGKIALGRSRIILRKNRGLEQLVSVKELPRPE